MSDTLVGVLIGGALASVLPAAMLFFECMKWKRDRRLAHLKSERERMEKVFAELIPQLKADIFDPDAPVSTELISTFLLRCPKSISDLYRETGDAAQEGRLATVAQKEACYDQIVLQMHAELAELDKRIEAAAR